MAWIGPTPSSAGGVPSMATQQLLGLAHADVEIEAFVGSPADDLPQVLGSCAGLKIHHRPLRWHYGRWYSKTDMTKHLSGAAARTAHLRRTGFDVVARHHEQPFDIVYQLSMPELFAFHGRRRQLPPIIVHPEVHAAGELRWHARERALAREDESMIRHYGVRGMLKARSVIQGIDLPRADLVISPAMRFAQLLQQDYGVPEERLRVIPNPVDTQRFLPGRGPVAGEPRRFLFVSRIAVRKGVDAIVQLSHQIADLGGQVIIEVIGDRSLWSDYRHLLTDLHPATAVALGPLANEEISQRLQGATALLQPSQYEPFGLTAAEALATGTPVITSDEVGATENVDARVGRRVVAGDARGLEHGLRNLLLTVQDRDAERELRALCRVEAERLFATDVVGRQLAQELQAFLAQ